MPEEKVPDSLEIGDPCVNCGNPLILSQLYAAVYALAIQNDMFFAIKCDNPVCKQLHMMNTAALDDDVATRVKSYAKLAYDNYDSAQSIKE